MKVDALGFNLHLFSQRYVEELIRTQFPYARLNDVTPCFITDKVVVKQNGIYYVGMLTATSSPSLDGATLFFPLNEGGAPSHNPFFTLFDSCDAEVTFIGWKASLDGGIEPPTTVDPPPPSDTSLMSLIQGEIYVLGVDSPLNYNGESALAIALVEPNEYVRRVCFFGDVGGVISFYPDDRDVTGNNVRWLEFFAFDPGPVGTRVGVVATNDLETAGYGRVFEGVTDGNGDLLPFSYVAGVFTWPSYDPLKWDILITPFNASDVALDVPTIVDNVTTVISAAGVAYYKVIMRRYFANQWIQAPDLLIKA